MDQIEPEAELSIQERRISESRTRTITKRRSRAQIEKKMTPAMLDAEREIESAFRMITAGMGYGSNDLNRARGGTGEMSDEQAAFEQRMKDRYSEWKNTCPERYSRIVINVAAEAMTAAEIATRGGIARQTVIRRFHAGLKYYCDIHKLQ